MLNELRQIGLAVAGAGIPVSVRHPDVRDVSKRATLRVRLASDGSIWKVVPLGAEEAGHLWTLRDGQHNSFPYHQIKYPLLRVSPDDERLEIIRGKRHDEAKRWAALLSLAGDMDLNEEAFAGWPGAGYLKRLAERRAQLAALDDTAAAGVPAAFDRFARAAEQPLDLLRAMAESLVSGVHRGRIATEFPLISALLVDGGGPLYFDVDRDFERLAGDAHNVAEISRALRTDPEGGRRGVCALTGEKTALVSDAFPQPTLPVLGQTYLFARNKDAPTNTRYGRVGADAVAIGSAEASALQAAVEAVTRDEWRDRTWRSIPGERPKQLDLFIAFVPGVEEPVQLAELLTEDAEFRPGAEEQFASFAERLVKAFKGKVKERGETRLSLLVLRKLDPANRKAVYSESLSVDTLLEAARRWSKGCRNTPGAIRLLMPGGRGEPARPSPPREIAPFSLTPLTRRLFIRGGTQVQEVVGRTADEAMRLFLAPPGAVDALARTLLHYVLQSRGSLLEGVGHAQARGFDDLKAFDRREALDTITLLGLLLYRLGRTKEVYMKEVAFKLGRLLAAADALHAGYNASERGGSALPPRLIGNAVLPLAQSDPLRALEVLGRRWVVYHGWAQRNSGFRVPEPKAGGGEQDAKAQQETARAWQIRNGITAARRARRLAEDLHGKLPPRGEVPEHFRAELLLGYVAGPPRGDETIPQDHDSNDTPQQGDE